MTIDPDSIAHFRKRVTDLREIGRLDMPVTVLADELREFLDAHDEQAAFEAKQTQGAA